MIAGVDEAGRGALAGPLVAAAVIFIKEVDKTIFKDSKTLAEKERKRLYNLLIRYSVQKKIGIGMGVHSARYIDKVNVLKATLSAMKYSVKRLRILPKEVLIDGNQKPFLKKGIRVTCIVKGDSKIPEISAASIIAKVYRDMIMEKLDTLFPYYLFGHHKGYGTKKHYDAIFSYGVSIVHRKSFNLTRQGMLFDVGY